MTMPGSDDLIKAVGANIQEKASLIWSVADALRGPCKPHEYGPAILPMTVIKRFRDRLLPAHGAVLAIMDMGSAVMTVKMVLEDLDDDRVQMLDCPSSRARSRPPSWRSPDRRWRRSRRRLPRTPAAGRRICAWGEQGWPKRNT